MHFGYSHSKDFGLLGTYSTNKRNIEIQLMRKFINQQKVKDLKFPEEYIQLCKEVFGSSKHSGSLHHTYLLPRMYASAKAYVH